MSNISEKLIPREIFWIIQNNVGYLNKIVLIDSLSK